MKTATVIGKLVFATVKITFFRYHKQTIVYQLTRYQKIIGIIKMENLTLSELLVWLEMSEETGHYRGYSRHAIALEYEKRIRRIREMEVIKNSKPLFKHK